MCCKMMVGDSKCLESRINMCFVFFIGIATTVSQFGAATTDYLWTRKAGGCIGTESRLSSCPAYPVAVSCTSANPAAVICSSPCKSIYLMLFHCIADGQ